MNFYISIITHPVTYGFFTKRKVDELVSICIVTEKGDKYQAVNKKAAKWKGIDGRAMASLPHDKSGQWKEEWTIANDIAAFIKNHSDNDVTQMYGYKSAKETVILQKLLSSPNILILDLYQDAYAFVTDNEEYVRETDEFTWNPLSFNHAEMDGILKGHSKHPVRHNSSDAKEMASWIRKFHSFLEKIKGEMILSSIPESNN